MERGNRTKFWLPDDLSKSKWKSPEKAAKEEFCIADTVKAFPVAGVANKEGMSESVLPLDVLVEIVLKLRHHELEPLSRVSTTLRQAVADARKMLFDYNTPVVTSSRRGIVSQMPATPKPTHVWNPKRSPLNSDEIAELKPPVMRKRKLRCEQVAASLRTEAATIMQ